MKPFNSLFPALALSGALILPACSEKSADRHGTPIDAHVTTTQKKVETITHGGGGLQKNAPIITPELLAEKQLLLPKGLILTKDGEIFSKKSGSIFQEIDIASFERFMEELPIENDDRTKQMFSYYKDQRGIYSYSKITNEMKKFAGVGTNISLITEIGPSAITSYGDNWHFLLDNKIFDAGGDKILDLPLNYTGRLTSYGDGSFFVSTHGDVILGNGKMFHVKRDNIQIKTLDIDMGLYTSTIVVIKDQKTGKLYRYDGTLFQIDDILEQGSNKTSSQRIKEVQKYLYSGSEKYLPYPKSEE